MKILEQFTNFSTPKEIWADLTPLGKIFSPMILPLYYTSVVVAVLALLIAYPILLAFHQCFKS